MNLPARRNRKTARKPSPNPRIQKFNHTALNRDPMKILENPTVRTTLIVGVATLGVAAIFVGPEDSKGILATTAENSASEGADKAPGKTSKADGSRKLVGTPADETDNTEIVEWGDEAFIDDTEGFDPTPSDDDGGFNPSPIDNDNSAPNPESNAGSASSLPELGADAGQPVAGAPVPIG